MLRAVFFAAALLAGCAPVDPVSSQGAPKDPPMNHQQHQLTTAGALSAPVSQTERVLYANDNGTTIEVPVGETIAVALVGVPTAGYLWDAAQVPAFLTEVEGSSGPTTTAQRQPGFAGGSHWEVTRVRATGPGQGTLRLEQRRPWEPKSEPASQTFTLTIVVR